MWPAEKQLLESRGVLEVREGTKTFRNVRSSKVWALWPSLAFFGLLQVATFICLDEDEDEVTCCEQQLCSRLISSLEHPLETISSFHHLFDCFSCFFFLLLSCDWMGLRIYNCKNFPCSMRLQFFFQWGSIRWKHRARWQHLFRVKNVSLS